MHFLTSNQIRLIKEKIALNRMQNSSLSIDILDHVCCMIEERLEVGSDYEKAETEVFSLIGVLQIQAIEQETDRLTQNKIIMKKRTKIIGLISGALMAVGFSLKMMHLPGAGVLWGIGSLFAVFGFTVFLSIDRFSSDQSGKDKLLGIIGFLGAACIIAGVGLKVLHLPGAYHIFIAGGGFLLMHYITTNYSVREDSA